MIVELDKDENLGWEVNGVLPQGFESVGDWAVHTSYFPDANRNHSYNIYHIHKDQKSPRARLYAINDKHECRVCGTKPSKGTIIYSKVMQLR